MSRRLLLPLLLLAALASMGVGEGIGEWRPPQYIADPGSMVNVRDFGAVGDGLTDDTAEIQAALDSAALAYATDVGDGGVVSATPGIFMISTTINVPNGVTFIGSGPSVTILRATAAFPLTGTPMVTLADEATGVCTKTNLKSIGLDANSRAELAISSDCIGHQSGLSRIRILGLVEDGILIDNALSPVGYTIDNVSIEYATAPVSTTIGIALEGAPRTLNNVSFVGTGSPHASSQGIRIDDPAAAMVNPVATNLRFSLIGNGLVLDDTRDALLSNIYCVSDTTECLQIETSNAGINVFNVYHDHNDGAANTLVDLVSSITYTDKHITEYYVGFASSVSDRNLIVRSSGSGNTAKVWVSGATSPKTCAAAIVGAVYYDTNARTSASPGALCVCDALAGVYQWHPIERDVPGDAGIPVNLTGASTTDCGT